VDAAFIGPSDLSADIGMPGQHTSEKVQQLTNDVLRRIKASGKAAGILAMTEDTINHALESGACFIGVGIDVVLFATAMRGLASNPTKPV